MRLGRICSCRELWQSIKMPIDISVQHTGVYVLYVYIIVLSTPCIHPRHMKLQSERQQWLVGLGGWWRWQLIALRIHVFTPVAVCIRRIQSVSGNQFLCQQPGPRVHFINPNQSTNLSHVAIDSRNTVTGRNVCVDGCTRHVCVCIAILMIILLYT